MRRESTISAGSTKEDELEAAVRAAIVAVAAVALALGALAAQVDPRLGLLAAAFVLGWSRLADP
ncbi:MAG TPA: hypothetical protein VFZ00_13705 [Solirubrobacter sp.]|nr:hypothetical protein [Solirubrobacter sp.]